MYAMQPPQQTIIVQEPGYHGHAGLFGGGGLLGTGLFEGCHERRMERRMDRDIRRFERHNRW